MVATALPVPPQPTTPTLKPRNSSTASEPMASCCLCRNVGMSINPSFLPGHRTKRFPISLTVNVCGLASGEFHTLARTRPLASRSTLVRHAWRPFLRCARSTNSRSFASSCAENPPAPRGCVWHIPGSNPSTRAARSKSTNSSVRQLTDRSVRRIHCDRISIARCTVNRSSASPVQASRPIRLTPRSI